MSRFIFLFLPFFLLLNACSNLPENDISSNQSSLKGEERIVRAALIRDIAAENGLYNGWALAGIAQQETQLSHCWSELTWACKGPNSDDCDGGPVVAGSGDGPCSKKQGGLGMFQFDAGTFKDTLERDGEEILTLRGNIEKAISFVLQIIMKSKHIADIETEEDALAWINEMELDGTHFETWIKTVTHYYNGCNPDTCSIYDERFAAYEKSTQDVYSEMGDNFWNESSSQSKLKARFLHQTFPLPGQSFDLAPNETYHGYIDLINEGPYTWEHGKTFVVSAFLAPNQESPLIHSSWYSENYPASVSNYTKVGEIGRFEFAIQAPSELGKQSLFLELEHLGEYFGQTSGYANGPLVIQVNVTDTPQTCDSAPYTWGCSDNGNKEQCAGGTKVIDYCPKRDCQEKNGIAFCASDNNDFDQDGYLAKDDCNDHNASIHPGATDTCDQIDQNCNGFDDGCSKTDGPGIKPISNDEGCTLSQNRNPVSFFFLLGVLLFIRKKQQTI